MTVYETDVPGVGRKFEYELGGEDRLVVLIHHDGKREVFRRPSADADGTKLFELSDKQAREFGTILEGAYFQPVDLDRVEVPLGESIIEWTELPEGSPLDGESLREADLRQRTGVSVMAVQRGEETLANPESDFELTAGDILVTIGTRDEQGEFDDLISG
ncbi:potassium transporter TrkA (plasmid) [Halorussus salilacus]|uniref:cation:proton antiporter regulatory subunit n=1 Tax=Halorussus salilacus TaxID=2953750 RepID=UPI0020A166DF|nr:TrkA C-terminal domain-containing protein [Halorussus salilacus]USZ69858.1 potassium transporter TrkA [Halorussus salilacus]